jgi:hypothetical protein
VCKPSSKAQATVHAQHRRAMHTKDCDPRVAILADLRLFILKQQEALGDIIIVGIDANEDVRGRLIKPFFHDLQMRDAILTLHSTNFPSTNLANESSEPIYAIFCSRSILPSHAGFLGSTEGCPSDHVQLWTDLKKTILLAVRLMDFISTSIRSTLVILDWLMHTICAPFQHYKHQR